MQTKTISAPLALIKMSDGNGNFKTIGKMKNIRVTETFRRVDVKGIGQLNPVERPVTDWAGTVTCQSMVVNLFAAGFEGFPNRKTNDVQAFVNTILTNEVPLAIFMYSKVKNAVDASGIVTSILEDPIAAILDAYIERDAFDIVEGQLMGKDQDFSYLTPILAL